jgi:conjugative transfer signal peptidase TraF
MIAWRLAIAVSTGIVVASFLIAWGADLRINLSDSMAPGLYRITPLTRPLKHGDMIAVCPPYSAAVFGRERGYVGLGHCPGGVEPLLKFVEAVGGDRLTFSARGVAVNGSPLLKSKCLGHDEAGRELHRWNTKHYIVPPKMLWLYAPSSRSWDSRYWGPVSEDSVEGLAVPILVGTI